MDKKKHKIFPLMLIPIFAIVFWIISGGNHTEEQKKYIKELEEYRAKNDIEFRDSSYSPFNYKSKVEFHSLNYFDANFDFIFTGKLVENEIKDTVKVFGTKGEERKSVRFGVLKLQNEKHKLDLKLYETLAKDGVTKYYSIWFTDKTTNEETYGVGRYLNFELNENPEFIYTIDFNFAYNPYCAYSSEYSCAIPTKEDYLDIAIEAGEKKFHE
ncbi:MAG: DUF1684 domain-containing protein [Bacteroidetes bacterium]|nr:DUF1684 domain-containing protein [Bacteroidota bacterium]MBU1115274.1 DUF1684 domain-containing protein [Bacteroidota bacterium]MBU1799245.1 DUF1684 domain-containing protein [Bacteroidota bacterium]